MRRLVFLWLSSLFFLAMNTGCASTEGPAELIVSPDQYHRVFDAAVEAARQEGMYATFVDRRGGIIESSPRLAASLIEPWRQDNAGFNQAFENTLHQQQRRVRFQFLPADEPKVAFDPDQPLGNADLADMNEPRVDLTTYQGDMRLLATVAIERQYRAGVQRDTWSRRLVSTYKMEGVDGDLPATWWATIARDEAFERRLLAEIERATSLPSSAP